MNININIGVYVQKCFRGWSERKLQDETHNSKIEKHMCLQRTFVVSYSSNVAIQPFASIYYGLCYVESAEHK